MWQGKRLRTINVEKGIILPRKFLGVMICAVLLTAGWAAAASEVEYFAIFAEGLKIGHAIRTRNVQDDKVVTTSTMSISVKRLGKPTTVAETVEHTETPDGKPLAFKVVQKASLMPRVVEGKITPDGKVEIVIRAEGQTQRQTLDWPKDALLSEGTRLLQQRFGLKEGLTYSYSDGESDDANLRSKKTTVHVIGRRSVDILGQREMLWEIRSEKEGETNTVYVDDDFKVRKSSGPEGGINLEMLACTKEFALGKVDSFELSEKLLVDSPRPLNNLSTAGSVMYRFVPSSESQSSSLTVPSYDNQKVVADPSGLTITVTAQKIPSGMVFPYKGNDTTALEAMKPSMYLESQKPEVVALARRAIGTTKDAAEAVRRIETFVRHYVTNDRSVAYASAGEVARTRRGDCTEHALLAAALCRAVGIPARVVSGITYVGTVKNRPHVFGPHAWMTAYLGRKWVQFDPMLSKGYDLGHIALASGDGDPHYRDKISSTDFRIVEVTVRAKSSGATASSDTGQ